MSLRERVKRLRDESVSRGAQEASAAILEWMDEAADKFPQDILEHAIDFYESGGYMSGKDAARILRWFLETFGRPKEE